MNVQCPDLLELDQILALPDADPRRQHVDACPECRGRLEAMELFLDPGETPELEGLAAADAQLADRLDRSARPARRTGAPRARRFGLALAAVLAVVAVGLTTSELLRTGSLDPVSPGQHLRGRAGPASVTVTASRDGIALAWPAAPVADQILYVFFAGDMTEIGRRAADEALVLAPDDPMAGAAYCQAVALVQGDVIARSGIGPLVPDPE